MKESIFKTPDQLFGELFEEVQRSHIFSDSKSFADATPKQSTNKILEAFKEERQSEDFDLKKFVLRYFVMPDQYSSGFKSDLSRSAIDHINSLWPYLTRKGSKDKPDGSSLIPIPNDYIVPGGRFGEIYYWDSYFTMLGLSLSGHERMIRNMIENFAHLIQRIGFIPNGNRSYFSSRSQPPYFSLMIQLLAEIEGASVFPEFHQFLVMEYKFWMEQIEGKNPHKRVIREGDHILNRYWDNADSPRQEMYIEDIELSKQNPKRDPSQLYRDIRCACESGWDFSSRWLADGMNLGTIETSKIIPVDLNCLLWNLESVIQQSYKLKGDHKNASKFESFKEKRAKAIRKLFWHSERSQFEDYHLVQSKTTGRLSLATCYPLFFNLATESQAKATAKLLETHFLKLGGVISTPYHTGQQWDAPNGWAPLQWMAVKGLDNYGFIELAKEIANRWCSLCESVYKSTGKFVEKYNVENVDLLAGGGEYPVQDGFGWSNGVYLTLKDYLGELT